MKSIKKILTMLNLELIEYFKNINSTYKNGLYFNQSLGNTSFLLAGLLEAMLRKNDTKWDRKWIDDSLISNIIIEEGKRMRIGGIMIWGEINMTKQWVSPFCFEIEFHKEKVKDFIFLYADDKDKLTYEKFRDNRNHWENSNIVWKYKIESNSIL